MSLCRNGITKVVSYPSLFKDGIEVGQEFIKAGLKIGDAREGEPTIDRFPKVGEEVRQAHIGRHNSGLFGARGVQLNAPTGFSPWRAGYAPA